MVRDQETRVWKLVGVLDGGGADCEKLARDPSAEIEDRTTDWTKMYAPKIIAFIDNAKSAYFTYLVLHSKN